MEEKHVKILRENRIHLCRDLDGKSATSVLYSKDIISEHDKEEIEAAKTPRDRNEKLLDILAKRGPKAFGTFTDFLQAEQLHLFTLLCPITSTEGPANDADESKPEGKLGVKPVAEITAVDGGQASGISSTRVTNKHEQPGPANNIDESKPEGKSGVEPVAEITAVDGGQASGISSTRVTNKHGSDEGDGNSPSSHSDVVNRTDMYPMSHSPRGRAFIINNKIFEPSSGMGERKGTDVDAAALKKLFGDLDFKTEVFHNVRSKKTIDIFDEYANMDYSQFDCFMCAILTHGKEGTIYSTEEQLQINQLTSKFRGKLIGKPKLFFFQACQGEIYMDGVDRDEVDGHDNDKIYSTLPVEADFMYAYSTVPGYYSWRNSARGTWFAQAIVSVFKQHARTMDVLRMMTRVNADVATQKSNTGEGKDSHNKKQIPSVISQLRKDLYFFPENIEGTANKDGPSIKKEAKCSVS